MNIEQVIAELELLKAEIEGVHSIMYQTTLDKTIRLLKVLNAFVKEDVIDIKGK